MRGRLWANFTVQPKGQLAVRRKGQLPGDLRVGGHLMHFVCEAFLELVDLHYLFAHLMITVCA